MRYSVLMLSVLNVARVVTKGTVLTAPQSVTVSGVDPLGLFIKWRPLTYKESDPVGYKVNIWKLEESSQGYYKLVNGEQYPGLVNEVYPIEIYNIEKIPEHEPIVYVVDGKKLKITINDIEWNVLYEVRVQACKKNEDGPFSTPVRVKLVKSDTYTTTLQREGDACMITVASTSTIGDETYSHYDNFRI